VKTKKRRIEQWVWCEVVRVDCPQFLVSQTHQACRYATGDGVPLVPGYYLALWPSGACRSTYGRELRYLGPCPTQSAARFLQTSAVGLGIIDLVVEHVPTVVPWQPSPPHVHPVAPCLMPGYAEAYYA
jgi:hypothetical protein